MKVLADVGEEEVWADLVKVVKNGLPCFVGTKSEKVQPYCASLLVPLLGVRLCVSIHALHGPHITEIQTLWRRDDHGMYRPKIEMLAAMLQDQKLYDELREAHNLFLYTNHCYRLVTCEKIGGVRYRLRPI